MIYHLLQIWFPDWILTNLFRYITFRAFLAALVAFIFVVYFMPKFIRWFQRASVGQVVRDDGPQTHYVKKGTPTMGGVLMVWAVAFVSAMFCRLNQIGVWILLTSFVSAGMLGFVDDYLKIAKKNSKGVSGKAKMLYLGLLSLGICYWMLSQKMIQPEVHFPFVKSFSLDIGAWFYLWAFLVIVGTSNAVNITDGLDGLAIVPVMTTSVVFVVISYISGHALFSEYLQIKGLPGAGEMSVLLAGVVGAGLGFLWFNAHPAEIFMGDVGSLSLGALLGTAALLIHQELVLFIAGFLFVMEAVSVILQVGYYKISHKRIFRMAPLHHHFELGGWPESKVIARFWILSIIFAVMALTTLKLR